MELLATPQPAGLSYLESSKESWQLQELSAFRAQSCKQNGSYVLPYCN